MLQQMILGIWQVRMILGILQLKMILGIWLVKMILGIWQFKMILGIWQTKACFQLVSECCFAEGVLLIRQLASDFCWKRFFQESWVGIIWRRWCPVQGRRRWTSLKRIRRRKILWWREGRWRYLYPLFDPLGPLFLIRSPLSCKIWSPSGKTWDLET